MRRRNFITAFIAGSVLVRFPVTWASTPDIRNFHDLAVPDDQLQPLDRDAASWRDKVTEDAWRILFEEETEPAGTSALNNEDRNGTFVCAACYLPLFSSDTKYESGTGWPSFWAAHEKHMGTKTDYKAFWPRTEYHCVRCGGHQGHVFDDGPEPTGKRWCNNGLALKFVPEGESLPALRG
ncbi:MAG: peptide-methionine (R)-S-oxide reductase MsrB [Pseudomonadota bacterium]